LIFFIFIDLNFKKLVFKNLIFFIFMDLNLKN